MTRKVGLFHGSPAHQLKSLAADGDHVKAKVIASGNIGAAS